MDTHEDQPIRDERGHPMSPAPGPETQMCPDCGRTGPHADVCPAPGAEATGCARCGKNPADGFTTIGGKRYCHGDGDEATCFIRQQWEDMAAAPTEARGLGERVARALADALPDSGDDCFDSTAYEGDSDAWANKEEDRDWYRRFAARLLASGLTLAESAAPETEGQR